MGLLLFLFLLLWGVISLTMFIGIAPYCRNLTKQEKNMIYIIFIIGGPFFAISNILQELLNTILPEGWDNENDFKGY